MQLVPAHSGQATDPLESKWIEPPVGVGPIVDAVPGLRSKVDSTQELRWEEGPGVMRRSVGVVERDAIEIDVVIAIGKAAEVSARLAKTDAICYS